MFGEVLQDYAGHPVPSAQGRYRDFLVWLQGQDKAGAEDFWRGQLAELDEPTRLASACHGRTVPGPGKQMHRLHFDEVFTQRLNSFSRQQQVTLNSLVQAAWLLVLQRYTGQDCVAFGEISLSGEIRAVGRAEARLREAQKLGFDRALTPPLTVKHKGVSVTSVKRLTEAVERISQNRY